MKFFNTAGPVNCKKHYCLNPLERFDLEEVLLLIEQEKYFVLHAPRQTGKTTCLLALMEYLNTEGTYSCLYFNVENAQAARENVKEGMRAILAVMAEEAEDAIDDSFLENHWKSFFEEKGEYAALQTSLSKWSKENSKPIVLLIDEIDALVGDTLISLLRQLRSGYTKRPALFPQTIILCGVRDVRDYRIHSKKGKEIITGGSAFNIKAASLRVGDFSYEDLQKLYQYHTDETGQIFQPEAVDLVWEFSEGQPWLVNALGYEVCFDIKENRDRNIPITGDMILKAKENIILRRETHIDQLTDKLQEERVRCVIEPMLEGVNLDFSINPDDIQYVIDLGLIKRDKSGIRLANPIYREVVPREITFIPQLNFESNYKTAWYVRKDTQKLDMEKLLAAFQSFFREHSESWVERFQYKEAGPQLLMQAFLQRIVNSGGRVDREYGLGRKRTDLLVVWQYPGGVQKVVIELKIRYGDLEKTITKGLKQTSGYMDKCGTDDGHLVIFDRAENKSWEDKVFQRDETFEGKKVRVWGM